MNKLKRIVSTDPFGKKFEVATRTFNSETGALIDYTLHGMNGNGFAGLNGKRLTYDPTDKTQRNYVTQMEKQAQIAPVPDAAFIAELKLMAQTRDKKITELEEKVTEATAQVENLKAMLKSCRKYMPVVDEYKLPPGHSPSPDNHDPDSASRGDQP